MPRIAFALAAILMASAAVAQTTPPPAIDPRVLDWVYEAYPKLRTMLPPGGVGQPAAAVQPSAPTALLPGAGTGQMPIWECRDIVRNNPDWPRHPEMVAFMRKCGVFPPRPRPY